MKNPDSAGVDGSGGFESIGTPARRFTADQFYIFIFDEVIKTSDCIGTSAYTCDNRVGQTSFFHQDLFFDFF